MSSTDRPATNRSVRITKIAQETPMGMGSPPIRNATSCHGWCRVTLGSFATPRRSTSTRIVRPKKAGTNDVDTVHLHEPLESIGSDPRTFAVPQGHRRQIRPIRGFDGIRTRPESRALRPEPRAFHVAPGGGQLRTRVVSRARHASDAPARVVRGAARVPREAHRDQTATQQSF